MAPEATDDSTDIPPGSLSGDSGDPVLREILGALDMPRSGLRAWLAGLQAFCEKHGGARHYADLLELVAACRAELEQGGDRAHRRSDPARR